MIANGDHGPGNCHPLMSQGTSPATTPGATTKKTALPTAAADRCMLNPRLSLGRHPVGVRQGPWPEDRLADPHRGRPILDSDLQITGHTHGQLVIGASDVIATLQPSLQITHAFEARPNLSLIIRQHSQRHQTTYA